MTRDECAKAIGIAMDGTTTGVCIAGILAVMVPILFDLKEELAEIRKTYQARS